MPLDSNWKIASVRPSEKTLSESASSSAIFERSSAAPVSVLIVLRQSSMIVSVVSARKSIFSMPVFSRSDMAYCVVISSLADL